MLTLIIDDREKAVIPFFKEYQNIDTKTQNIEIKIQRIQVGDYIISRNDKIIAAVERKSWTDLAASIKDGRATNINKMISLREQTGCKLFYLMEGKSRYPPTKKFARIPYKNLQSHLDHLTMRDNVHILHSDSEEDTAIRLIEFMTNYLTLPTLSTDVESVENVRDDQKILTTTVPKTELEIIYNIWSCIPNITSKTATLFISTYHISDLFLGLISKATISTMQYPNGSIIGKRSEKIINVIDNTCVNNHKIYCRILAEIPGITKKTAALILVKVKFNDLLCGTLSLQEIADIKKTEKSRVGIAIAKKIFMFLVKSEQIM